MRESQVEKYLHQQVIKLGGTTRKWISPSRAGVPDRICFLPGGLVVFVEVKTDSGKTTVRQQREIASLKALGAMVLVAHGTDGVDAVIDDMKEIGARVLVANGTDGVDAVIGDMKEMMK